MTTKTRNRPKPKRITGVAATEEYLPEPKLDGALLRLPNDRGDFSRVQAGAVSLLSLHDAERSLGKVISVMPASGELRFAADLPVGQGVKRVDDYAADLDAGLRGFYSVGFGIRAVDLVGRRNGVPMFDADWVLTEVSDHPKPSDTNAKMDRGTAAWVSDDALASARELGDGLGDVNIHPAGRVPRHDDLKDLDLGRYFRVLMDPREARRARREVAWMERNLGFGFHQDEGDTPVIPFALLATCGPAARERAAQRARAGVSAERYLESFMPAAEAALQELLAQEAMPSYGERVLTTAATSAGAMSGITVDVAHAIMWLTEQDGALDLMTVVPGLMADWQGFYGNVAPEAEWPAEGADLTERNPTMQRLIRRPSIAGLHWRISTSAIRGSDNDLAGIIEAGCAEVVQTQMMRAMLSGPDVAADFAEEDENVFDGLLTSGIAEIGYGAAITDLSRADMIAARRRLRASQAKSGADNLGWLLSEDVAKQLEVSPRSASGGDQYLLQDGMVDTGAVWLPARESVHLGKAGVTAPAVLVDKACALALIWGSGIMLNALQRPGQTAIDYDLQVGCSFAMMDPSRAQILKLGAPA